MTILLALTLLVGPARWATPGDVSTVDRATVCATPWRSDLGLVADETAWRTALTRTGLAWTDRYAYTPTPRVPQALGGTLSAANLLPLSKASDWNAARHDDLGHAVYDLVCSGRTRRGFVMDPPMPLAEAQIRFLQWEMNWRLYVKPEGVR